MNYPRDLISARINLTSWNKTQWSKARFEVLIAVKVWDVNIMCYLLLKWVCQDTNNDSDGEWGIEVVFCYAYKIN